MDVHRHVLAGSADLIEFPLGIQYATGVDECVKAVREQISRGITWIKLYSDWKTATFSFGEMHAIVSEAQKYNIEVAAHATTKEGAHLAIMAGVESIEHGFGFDDSLIQLTVKKACTGCRLFLL